MELTQLYQLYQLYLRHLKVGTDSRSTQEGELFFALSGPSFDGNDYALFALEKGASYAIVSRKELAEQDERCIYVPDTLRCLQELATLHRKEMNVTVLAISGTNGKTTTKELCAQVLSQHYNVLATIGNLNNHLGVPLTLLRLKPEHEIAIIEMGASGRGEIALLSKIAQPNLGLITNIGKAHLQGFGSQIGILDAKSELFDYLQETGGDIILNTDDPLLTERWCHKAHLCYGRNNNGVHLSGEIQGVEPYLQMSIKSSEEAPQLIKSALTGGYNYQNILAASAVGAYFNIPAALIAKAIASYIPSNNRSQIIQTESGRRLILDAYNANPSSMLAALENLNSLSASYKIAILGDMLELGGAASEEHAAIVEWLNAHPTIHPYLCGKEFAAVNGFLYPSFYSTDELKQELETAIPSIPSNCCILLKGSRGIALEKLLPLLNQ